jgi:uncharacterized repeat protein (TIGR03837 family)
LHMSSQHATPHGPGYASLLRRLHIDLFCRVVDNLGDIGVCWRLACDLARRGHAVSLWVDDASALGWMAPNGHPGVAVLPWNESQTAQAGDVVIEAFGCEIDAKFVATNPAKMATSEQNDAKKPVWINLEYLSAEPYVERCHALPSPIMHGPCVGMTKWFFYPGFTPKTGGLIHETGLEQQQAAFDPNAWLARLGLRPKQANEALVSLFCYEPAALAAWLANMAQGNAWQGIERTRLLVTPGRAAAAVRQALQTLPQAAFFEEIGQLYSSSLAPLLSISYLPTLPQPEFDHLLWACDLNSVRGEDSLVRALWAGKPVLWQLYPQADLAHHAKLQAWLDALAAPNAMRHMHRVWNGVDAANGNPLAMPPINLPELQTWASNARRQLLQQPSLTDQLLGFILGKNPSFGQKAL